MIVYDVSLPVGSRVVRLQARCVACRVPILEDVQDEEIYKVAMPSFIANGGDGYAVVRDQKVQHHLTGEESLLNIYNTLFCTKFSSLIWLLIDEEFDQNENPE